MGLLLSHVLEAATALPTGGLLVHTGAGGFVRFGLEADTVSVIATQLWALAILALIARRPRRGEKQRSPR